VIILGCLYSVLYVPSLMLTNSLAFHHLVSREREFPFVRLWGTIGFVFPAWLVEFWWLRGLEGSQLVQARGVTLLFAGIAGILMAVYSLTLPATPPPSKDARDFAPVKVVGLLRRRNFLVLVLVSFGIAIVHNYFFVWNSPFLKEVLAQGGVKGAWEQRISSIGQVAEVAVMTILGLMISRLGFKWTMAIGMAAYATRFVLLAFVGSYWVPFTLNISTACLAQALHGFCFGCFLAVAYMLDIRGSMQTVYGTFVIGVGFFLGGVISGEIGERFSSETGTDWVAIWMVGAALTLACLVAFVVFFPKETIEEAPAA
jgi:hypothetical protein